MNKEDIISTVTSILDLKEYSHLKEFCSINEQANEICSYIFNYDGKDLILISHRFLSCPINCAILFKNTNTVSFEICSDDEFFDSQFYEGDILIESLDDVERIVKQYLDNVIKVYNLSKRNATASNKVYQNLYMGDEKNRW